MKKKKILLLVSHYPDPLINKRLEMLKKKYKVMILYIKRGNNDFIKISDVNYKELSVAFANGKFFKRFFCLLKLKKEVKSIVKEYNPEFVYAFRLDMLLLIVCNGFKNKKIIYEIADLHNMIINSSKNVLKIIIRKILYLIEKKSCRNIDILSLTSEKYYDVYYYKFIPKEKFVFMPNIPNLEYFENYKRKKKNQKFTIGFIGVVRYKEQMKMLIDASEKTNSRILFAGIANDDEIMKLAKSKKYIEYYGPYNYNNDIAKLYSKCDCIYSVYDTKINNVKYALPNKLYESIYCELPILVSSDTYLSEIVNKLNVGLSVKSDSVEDLVNKINLLKENEEIYSKIVENCKLNKIELNINKYNEIFLNKLDSVGGTYE